MVNDICHIFQLISEAIRNGPENKDTMQLADFWILEKEYVHKLFKVLVPRYNESSNSFTKLHKIQNEYPGWERRKAVLELRGHIQLQFKQFDIFK